MAGHAASVAAVLLLYCSLTGVGSVPVSVDGYSPITACQSVQHTGTTTHKVGLRYLCTITQDNRQTVLREIKTDHILILTIDINEDIQDFVFRKESFSKDLEFLQITTAFPMLISSGAFRRSGKINRLVLSQTYNPLAMDTNNATLSVGKNNWTSLQLEAGWLMPLTGLIELYLPDNGIESFPDMQFCHLKVLKHLSIMDNRINSPEGLGITCNSSHGPCTPCLPNVEVLNIMRNPIKNLNINISYNLPHLTTLDLTGCSLVSVNLDLLLSPTMETLDIRSNELSTIVIEDLSICNSSPLLHLYLSDNSLHTMSAGLFGCINRLTELNISNNLLSEESLIRAGLNNLTELTLLDISYNNLTTLRADLIGNLVNVQRLDCNGCGLKLIGKDNFINSDIMFLYLRENRLHSIDGSTFMHLKNLFELDLSNNQLIHTPDFSSPITRFRVLTLDRNRITKIEPERLSGLSSHLIRLSLAFNQIKNIPDNALSNLPFLQELNLNNNYLKVLKFDHELPYSMITLRLSNNSLTAIPSAMLKTDYLRTVDLSWNQIRKVQPLRSDTMKTLDLSFNSITKFDCLLSDLKNLQLLNLTHNKLRELHEDLFVTFTHPRPQVLLEGNPLHCDCRLEWLLSTRSNSPYQELKQDKEILQAKHERENISYRRLFHAEVADLDTLQCTTSGRGGSVTSGVTAVDFLCPYTEECNKWECGDDCCEEDPECPCNVFCYPECMCYHKRNHQVDFMNCTSRHITHLPPTGPTYVTHIYLDGNNLTYLNLHDRDFPALTTLFVNKSNVLNVHPGAFKKLNMLHVLHLQQNHIEEIKSNTFSNVFDLKELYLQDNQISSIENNSFSDNLYLRILNLHGNNLTYLNLSLFEGLNFLVELTLHGNPWSCDCEFGPVFQKWLTKHSQVVTDIADVYCVNETLYTAWGTELTGHNTRAAGREFRNTDLVIDIDFSYICHNGSVLTTIKYKHIKSITEVTSLAVSFGVFMLFVIAVYKNLLLIKVWLYNRFGVRLHREENDNADKPYDVFLMYPRQEDRFVVQNLLPQLEEGDMSYRVCLEGRDWPPGADRAETIIASVQQSKRTILLVSEHHFTTQWCEFTFEAGHYQVLMDKQIRLIIILTDERLKARMNRTMKMYTSTNAFLVVGEKWFWKKLRYYPADNPRGADGEAEREFELMQVYVNQGQ